MEYTFTATELYTKNSSSYSYYSDRGVNESLKLFNSLFYRSASPLRGSLATVFCTTKWLTDDLEAVDALEKRFPALRLYFKYCFGYSIAELEKEGVSLDFKSQKIKFSLGQDVVIVDISKVPASSKNGVVSFDRKMFRDRQKTLDLIARALNCIQTSNKKNYEDLSSVLHDYKKRFPKVRMFRVQAPNDKAEKKVRGAKRYFHLEYRRPHWSCDLGGSMENIRIDNEFVFTITAPKVRRSVQKAFTYPGFYKEFDIMNTASDFLLFWITFDLAEKYARKFYEDNGMKEHENPKNPAVFGKKVGKTTISLTGSSFFPRVYRLKTAYGSIILSTEVKGYEDMPGTKFSRDVRRNMDRFSFWFANKEKAEEFFNLQCVEK